MREVVSRALEDLGPSLSAGRLSLPIARTSAFAEVNAAYAWMRSNQHFGKIVILPPGGSTGL